MDGGKISARLPSASFMVGREGLLHHHSQYQSPCAPSVPSGEISVGGEISTRNDPKSFSPSNVCRCRGEISGRREIFSPRLSSATFVVDREGLYYTTHCISRGGPAPPEENFGRGDSLTRHDPKSFSRPKCAFAVKIFWSTGEKNFLPDSNQPHLRS